MTGGEGQTVQGGRPSAGPTRHVVSATETTTLADLLERVLDKGIVIAGDITLSLGTVEVLTLKIRLLIASVDKAQEIGINWWQSDPSLSSHVKDLEVERDQLKQRLDRLEERLSLGSEEVPPQRAESGREDSPP